MVAGRIVILCSWCGRCCPCFSGWPAPVCRKTVLIGHGGILFLVTWSQEGDVLLGPERGWKGGYYQSHAVYTTKFSKLNLKIKSKCMSYSVDYFKPWALFYSVKISMNFMSLNYKNLYMYILKKLSRSSWKHPFYHKLPHHLPIMHASFLSPHPSPQQAPPHYLVLWAYLALLATSPKCYHMEFMCLCLAYFI